MKVNHIRHRCRLQKYEKANYHEAQITLIDAVLVPFLSLTWNMFLFARTFLTLFKLSENLKEIQ